MVFDNSRNSWLKKNNGSEESFMGFLHLFSNKTAMTLNGTAFVVFPVQSILLNVLINNKDNGWYTMDIFQWDAISMLY